MNTDRPIDELMAGADSGQIGTMKTLVLHYLGGGNPDAAFAWAETLTAVGDLDGACWAGMAFERNGYVREARDIYAKGAASGHDHSMVQLGRVLHRAGDETGAESWFARAARVGNRYGILQYGAMLQLRGTWRGAASVYSHAARQNTEDAKELLRKLEVQLPRLVNWDALRFTTFGWRQVRKAITARQWAHSSSFLLTAVFVPEETRLADAFNLAQTLDVPVTGPADSDNQGNNTKEHPTSLQVLSYEEFSVTSASANAAVLLAPNRFVRAVTVVALPEFYWMLRIDSDLSAASASSTVESVEHLESQLRGSLGLSRPIEQLGRDHIEQLGLTQRP